MSRAAVLKQVAQDLAAIPASLARDLSWKIADARDDEPVVAGSIEITDEQKAQWNEHGWIILKKSVTDEALEALNAEIDAFRDTGRGGRDELGHGVRVGLLHAENRMSLKVALNPHVQAFLRWVFGGEPALFGSLTFDIGSEQEPHIDAAFFYTQPEHAMAAAWTALDDVHPDSGPLFYVDRSHRLDRLYAAEVLAHDPELARRVKEHRARSRRPDYALSEDVYRAYSKRLQGRLEESGLKPTPAVLEKGDVFVWNGWIIHGGMPRVDRRLTRRSMVVHYIRRDAKFFDQHAFFLRGDILDQTRPMRFRFRDSRRGSYIKYHRAVTFDGSDGHFKA
jgi:hypothetical protein